MTTHADLARAAELLGRLVPQATPGPWRDSTVDGSQYAALIAETCTRDCDQWNERWSDPPSWASHPHDGYGGCLIGESMVAPDRRLLAVLRNVAEDVQQLLDAAASDDGQRVLDSIRAIAQHTLDTHRPLDPSEVTSA